MTEVQRGQKTAFWKIQILQAKENTASVQYNSGGLYK